MGGFSRYGEINEDWVMMKGTVQGARKRIITLPKRRSISSSLTHLPSSAMAASKLARKRQSSSEEPSQRRLRRRMHEISLLRRELAMDYCAQLLSKTVAAGLLC